MRGAGLGRLAAVLLGLGALAAGTGVAEPLRLGDFTPSADPAAPPPGWEALTFPRVARHTRYTVVRDGSGFVLRAEAEASASALYRPLDLDPRVHRVLSWRWKVEGVLARSDPRRKAGDDYAARVYVTLRYDPATAVGTVLDNAYSARAKIVVARSGAALAGTWGTETHDIYADYRRIVGGAGEPPRIEGIALMTDTDDTGERVVAYYDAITLGPGPRE